MSSPSFESLAPPQQGQDVGVGCKNALTRRVLGERLAGGLLAGEGRGLGRFSCRHLGEKIIFRGRRLDLFELQLELVDEAGRAFGGLTVLLALELGDLQLEMGNDRVAIGELRMHGCSFRALLQQ